MKKSLKKRVLIVGGGYAGISLLHKLKNENNLELILIDKSQIHLLQTHLHKYLSGYYSKDDITFNHEKYCNLNGINFICDEVTSVNYKDNFVITRENVLYHYDYLVLATGSLSIFPKQIENVIEYTKDIKKIENLDFYRNKFLQLINSKPINKSIIIVGGGVSGLQIACELAHTIKEKGLNENNIRVTLVEGMKTILPGMNKFLIEKSIKRCKELNIKILNNLFASKILEDKIILSSSDELSYDILFFVIGSTGNNIINNDDKVKHNQRNQVIVDDYYSVGSYNNVFAIGDIVEAIDMNTNTFQAPTAQAARMQAELIANNIIKSINNDTLIPNNVSNKGILIDLGGSNCAIGRLLNINLSGKLALWTKKLIYSLHAKKFN